MAFRRSFLLSFLVFSTLAVAFFTGFFIHDYFELDKDFPILRQVYGIIENHGLEPLPTPPVIEYGMIRGMLEAYGDPNTTFLEPIQQMMQADSLQGSGEGIGVEILKDESGNVILYPLPEGPAARAGVRAGDRLIRIGDLEVTLETNVETVQEELRSAEGDRVSLALLRPPEFTRIIVEINVETILLPSTDYFIASQDARVGVINISLIASSTPEEILGAVKELQNRGVSHFILDLRDNGGGLLTSGVDTARLFLSEGDILLLQYRENDVENFSVESPGPLVDLPIAVLVNEGTASAAEIVAGALQSHNRALLIGSPTYGKNSIQLVFDLQDGSSLHVTAARWWLPGREVKDLENGLQPDIRVRTSRHGDDPALERAVQILLAKE
jgi:carboxyl-terminal processing protease